MKNFQYLLIFFSLLLLSCKDGKKSSSPEKNPESTIVEKIARANGLENFDEVEELSYTFNVAVNDSLRTSRAWTWNPRTHQVTLTTADSTVTYDHKKEAAAHKEVDQRFINDQYWLLFPFHLVWDEMKYEHNEIAVAPISRDSLQQVVITYPANAGYTPGDVYEIYIGEDLLIKEWVYLSGGSRERPFAATWENYKDFEGIKVATEHQNADGNFRLFFTDVDVKFAKE